MLFSLKASCKVTPTSPGYVEIGAARWRAYLKDSTGKCKPVGEFTSVEDAKVAHDVAAVWFFGAAVPDAFLHAPALAADGAWIGSIPKPADLSGVGKDVASMWSQLASGWVAGHEPPAKVHFPTAEELACIPVSLPPEPWDPSRKEDYASIVLRGTAEDGTVMVFFPADTSVDSVKVTLVLKSLSRPVVAYEKSTDGTRRVAVVRESWPQDVQKYWQAVAVVPGTAVNTPKKPMQHGVVAGYDGSKSQFFIYIHKTEQFAMLPKDKMHLVEFPELQEPAKLAPTSRAQDKSKSTPKPGDKRRHGSSATSSPAKPSSVMEPQSDQLEPILQHHVQKEVKVVQSQLGYATDGPLSRNGLFRVASGGFTYCFQLNKNDRVYLGRNYSSAFLAAKEYDLELLKLLLARAKYQPLVHSSGSHPELLAQLRDKCSKYLVLPPNSEKGMRVLVDHAAESMD